MSRETEQAQELVRAQGLCGALTKDLGVLSVCIRPAGHPHSPGFGRRAVGEPLADDLDRALFLILCYHDVDVGTREQASTPSYLPDLSDIHTTTGSRIRQLFPGGAYDEGAARAFIESDPA